MYNIGVIYGSRTCEHDVSMDKTKRGAVTRRKHSSSDKSV